MYLAEQIHEINNNYSKLLRIIASKNNITFEQSKLLINIPFDGIMLSDLASILGIDNSTLTRNINKLLSKNYLDIQFDSYDKRKKILLLSSRGKKILNNIDKLFGELLEKLHLNIDEIQEIQKALEKLNWTLNCINNGKK